MDPPSHVQSFYHSAMMPITCLCTLLEEEEETYYHHCVVYMWEYDKSHTCQKSQSIAMPSIPTLNSKGGNPLGKGITVAAGSNAIDKCFIEIVVHFDKRLRTRVCDIYSEEKV